MNRSAIALGASALVLALSAGPANALPAVNQQVNDSALTAQVGSVDVNAPVRVASDGDNGSPATSGGGTQSTNDSIGTGQVGSVRVNAPVRVLSDGDNTAPGASGGGSQAAAYSTTTWPASIGCGRPPPLCRTRPNR